jgi:xanthine dehydrogenase large subunit
MKHESARGHVTGSAIYTDEQRVPERVLRLYPVQAKVAHARILGIDASAALAVPGVLRVLTAADVPGVNDTGTILHDEPLIPADAVSYHGQALAWVVAEDEETARRAAARVRVELEPLPAILSIDAAIAAQRFHLPPSRIVHGDVDAALSAAPHRISGEVRSGAQDHFYLETHSSWAYIDADGLVQLTSSTQHPSETQATVAHVLGLPANRVVCRCLRMGGGFGGKETQANAFAALAALAATLTGRPAGMQLPRSLDMQLTGKRHPFLTHFEVGFDHDGRLLGLRAELIADGGWSCDLSPPVLLRALVHIDNAYHYPAAEITGRIAKTHLPSNTAFRGFGGPQGMLVGEEILDRVARHLGLPPHRVRERNFYHEGQLTPYGQPVEDNELPAVWTALRSVSDFDARWAARAAFNDANAGHKRGLAITPVKFGISFNKTEFNQAGALVHLYTDGSVQLNHGGTEMGQGLHTKMIVVAANALGIDPARIRVMPTATDKVPNTSATAASSGADMNGQAVRAACETLKERLAEVAAARLACAAAEIRFVDDQASVAGDPARAIGFVELVRAAYAARVSLSATGYYRTPVIHWDPVSCQGHPFYYFAYGAAVAEVEVDGRTGVHRLLRIDIVHDVGRSLAEAIDVGQIEGGFVQGLGWLTSEEVVHAADGRLLTDAPSTYKIPTVMEVPESFHVHLHQRTQTPRAQVIGGSKAVGEPPLMLALAVREALRDAVAAFGQGGVVELASPATPEAVYRAIRQVQGRPLS